MPLMDFRLALLRLAGDGSAKGISPLDSSVPPEFQRWKQTKRSELQWHGDAAYLHVPTDQDSITALVADNGADTRATGSASDAVRPCDGRRCEVMRFPTSGILAI